MQHLHLLAAAVFAMSACTSLSPTANNGGSPPMTPTADTTKPVLLFGDCKSLPEFPRIAIEKNWQGTTVIAIGVNEHGEAVQSEIRQSSGYELLDKEAMLKIGKCTFKPARMNGVAIAGEALITYVWKIK